MKALRRRQTMPNSDDESDSDPDLDVLTRSDTQQTLVGTVGLDGKAKGDVKNTGLDKLWNEALQRLDEQSRARVIKEGQIAGQNNTFRLLMDGIQRQQNMVQASRLSYTKKSGEKVYVRDKMETVVTWFTKSQLFEVGNVLSEVSIYAAIPWTCISTIFTVAEHHMEADRTVMEGVEDISNMIARYTHYHESYLESDEDFEDIMKDKLEDAITKTFASTLEFLSDVIKFYKGSEKRRKRILNTFKATSIANVVEECLKNVRAEDDMVVKIIAMMDTDYQRKTRAFMDVNFNDMRGVLVRIQAQVEDFSAMMKGDDNKLQNIVGQIVNAITPKVESIETLKNWLGGWVIEDSYRDANDIRMENTCNWLLERDEYMRWKQPDDTKLLWIYGPPGSGKSVLCSTAIKDLIGNRPGAHNVAYFFCSARFENTRDPDSIVRSWVQQLLQDDFAHREATEYYSKQKTGTRASMHDVWELYTKIAKKMQDCICVLDGLDECFKMGAAMAHKSTMNRWLDFLMKLEKHSKETKVRLLLVSRDEPDIRQNLETWKAHGSIPIQVKELEVKEEYTRPDIELYSRKSVQDAVEYSDPPVSQETIEKLSVMAAENSKGMFLYITLLRNRLEQYVLNGRTEESLFEAIDELGDYDEAYGRILDMIQAYKGERRVRAEAVLRWVLFAARPLLMQELAEALEAAMYTSNASQKVKSARGSLVASDKLTPGYFQQIISLCGSFVVSSDKGNTNLEQTKTVDFVHFTAKEFLLAPSDPSDSNGREGFYFEDEARHQAVLAEICLRYLCSEEFKKPYRKVDQQLLDEKRDGFEFLDYAVTYVFQHIQNAGSAVQERSNVQTLLNKFFASHAEHWYLWAYFYEIQQADDSSGSSNTIDFKTFKPASKMYYCAHFGLVDTMKYLHNTGGADDLNTQGGKYGSPLQAAITNKHEEAVDLLLEWGADPNVTKLNDNALQAAVRTNASNTVQLLLEHGAKIDDDLLLQALRSNDLDIFHQLWTQIERSHSSIKNKEALLDQVAREAGVESFVKLLLKSGTSLTARVEGGNTVLHQSASTGQIENTKLILKEAQRRVCLADIIDAYNDSGKTPLWMAVSAGSIEVTELLLKYGAKRHLSKRNNNRTLMHAAAIRGHAQMILYLASAGLGVFDCDSGRRQPLQLALRKKQYAAARTLLELGANPNARDFNGFSPLAEAVCFVEDTETIQLLLKFGADINAEDQDKVSVLNRAVAAAPREIVRELMDQGADIRSTDRSGQNGLHYCARYGRPEVLRYLIEAGLRSDIDELEGTIGMTPIYIAVENNRAMMIRALIKHGADVNKRTREGWWTPLHEAVKKGSVDIAEALLEAGADPNAANDDGITVFHSCWRTGSVPLASLLFKHGADIHARRKDQFTALHYASFEGRTDFANFLIKNGANLEDQTKEGYTSLHMAVIKNHTAIVETLVGSGADVNARDFKSSTPLHYAANLGHTHLVELLISRKDIDLDARNGSWTTAINEAIKNGKADAARVLAKAGANLELSVACGPWPLIIESVFQDKRCLEALLAGGASIWTTDRYNSVCAHAAAWNGKTEQLELILRDLEAKYPDRKAEYFDRRNKWDRTPLIDASMRNHVKNVELLLRYGADVNARGHRPKLRPITIAANAGYFDVVKKLLESPQIKLDEPEETHTVLHYATVKGQADAVKMIIAKDREKLVINHNGVRGGTPLIEAAIHDRPVITQELINAGADKEKGCVHGMRPLHHASCRDHPRTIEALLKNGADIEGEDAQGRTPLACAIDHEQANTIKLLVGKGASIEGVGNTRQWLAREKGWI